MMTSLLPQAVAASLAALDLKLDVPHEIPELQTLLYETVLHGGKRFRPALCFLMAEILGVPGPQAAPYARVAELMHAATLAHDDVIDEAMKRRNRPTLNAIATNQKAVLTGDLLLARVVYEIAQLGNLDILRDGAQVLEDLVRGEWLQIDRRGKSEFGRELIEAAALKKTASLIAWCCTTPARLAGNSPELVDLCRHVGNQIGLSFQMADDILDFEREGEKPYANDLREGLVNFVVFEMIERDPSMRPGVQAALESSISGAEPTFPWTDEGLENAKSAVRDRVREMLGEARVGLREIVKLSPHKASESRDEAAESLDQMLALMAERMR